MTKMLHILNNDLLRKIAKGDVTALKASMSDLEQRITKLQTELAESSAPATSKTQE